MGLEQVSLLPGRGAYRSHLSTPTAGQAARLYDYGQRWPEERDGGGRGTGTGRRWDGGTGGQEEKLLLQYHPP